MKKIINLTYITLFFTLCCIPVFTIPVRGENSNMEKRQLQEFPSLWGEDGLNGAFPEQFEVWLSEHFAFRSELVSGWSSLQEHCFATSSHEKVVVGKSGWLFFSDTLEDYAKTNTLSGQEREDMVKTLELMNEYVTGKGGSFLFFSAPNKNTLYPEYMPRHYTQGAGSSRLQQLNERLGAESFYLDLLPAFADQTQQYYHKRDTHWNNYGAAVAYTAIMNRLQRPYTDWLSFDRSVERNWYGDLEQMLYPTGGNMDEQVLWEYPTHFRYTSSYHGPDDLTISTENEGKDGSLLMFRDSFGNALFPFFAEDYGRATFSRTFPFRLYTIEEDPCDTVIVELVERNLARLLEQAPIMPAPPRQPGRYVEIPDATLYCCNTLGLLHAYGTLPEEIAGDILVAVSDGTNTRYYEAFPILESELLGHGTSRGFSCYLPYADSSGLELNIITSINRKEKP